jgi:hypothetical protein
LADGARPDSLGAAMDSGALPALAALRARGALHAVTTCFPSVTGPAYTPFIMGRFPAPIGVPGLRWYDRTREACGFPGNARSYVGYQMPMLNRDIAADAPTIWEMCPRSIGAFPIVERGLPRSRRVGRITPRLAVRIARTHFTGDVGRWLQVDRATAAELVDRVRADRPDFVFAAFAAVDKVSHATGHDAPLVMDAMRIVDGAAAGIVADAERLGYREDLSIWVTSDHGHSPVHNHDDLERVIAGLGHRVVAHPWVVRARPEVAVMVSGNAMAHVYCDAGTRERRVFSDMDARWQALLAQLVERPSVDLAVVPTRNGAVVHSRERGTARVRFLDGQFDYVRESGDPLLLGDDLLGLCADDAHERTVQTDYPDSLVQIAHVALAPRSGDIILSATREWDFRSRYEPIPHVSSHGALHREHMLVPLLVDRPLGELPRRTVDVMPSALAALGIAVPAGLDGHSFWPAAARECVAAGVGA